MASAHPSGNAEAATVGVGDVLGELPDDIETARTAAAAATRGDDGPPRLLLALAVLLLCPWTCGLG